MPLTRRYVFHGHAAALGGRIVRIGEPNTNPRSKRSKARQVQPIRVEDGFIDLPGSVLAVVGGRSTAELTPRDFGQANPIVRQFVRFASARTQASGVFEDRKGEFESTQREIDGAALAPRTTVQATVSGLDVGLLSDVRMLVAGVTGGFSSTGAKPGAQTPVVIDPRTGFENSQVVFLKNDVAFILKVVVDLAGFNNNPTQSDLLREATKSKFLERFGHALHVVRGEKTRTLPSKPKLNRTDSGDIVATIVKQLKWEGREFPGSKIDPARPNRITIPGLGRLSFGEVLVGTHARRMTMIRGELGSEIGAYFAAVDVQDNGGWT